MKAYHYTVSDRIASIAKHGIKLSEAGVIPPEKPAVWFSTNPVYEMTALKSGAKSVQEMEKSGFMPIRYVVDMDMIDWEYHKAYSGIHPVIAQGLEESGRQCNANPSEWFAVYEPVKKWLAVEVYHDGEWGELEEEEMEQLASQNASLRPPFDEDLGFGFFFSVEALISLMNRAG